MITQACFPMTSHCFIVVNPLTGRDRHIHLLRDLSHNFTILHLDGLLHKEDVVLFEGVGDLYGTPAGEAAMAIKRDANIPLDGITDCFEQCSDLLDLAVGQ